MLTTKGYRVAKRDIPNLAHAKALLTVKPYIPAVFVKPQYVTRYPVFVEDDEYLYVPKHYGIQNFGPLKSSEREVKKDADGSHWVFSGAVRDAQKEVVGAFLSPEPRDGIISLQTGGGKTVCALYIASVLRVPTIVLVHNTFLRDQWTDRIRSFLPKARIGSIQGTIVDIENKDIVVAMLQTICMKDYPPKTFDRFGFLIVDECHHIASESFSQAIPKLTCKHTLGLSATPERKDKLMHVINWFLGPILYTSNAGDKVDQKVRVEVFEFEPTDHGYNEIIYNSAGVMFTSLMINKVVDYGPRNRLLSEIIQDLSEDPDRQILVLSDRVEHTKTLYDLLPIEVQAQACILGRDVKADQRADWCATKKILIATYSMCKEGFDVATLNTLVMATPRPDIDQIVGRILRTEKATRKIDPLIIDVVDPAFRRQFQQRNMLYRQRSYEVKKMKLI
jgi:superfamily II DNA or RNA helicase